MDFEICWYEYLTLSGLQWQSCFNKEFIGFKRNEKRSILFTSYNFQFYCVGFYDVDQMFTQ